MPSTHYAAQRNTARDRIVDRQIAMLEIRTRRQSAAKAPPQFSTLATIDGFDVIDTQGRAVDHRETRQSANGVAFVLNDAAAAGPKALIAALGAGR